MKRKFGTVAITTTLTVALSACSPASDPTLTQHDLKDYCGIDLNKLADDMKKEDPRIRSIKIEDTDCDIVAEYHTVDGEKRTETFSNDMMMGMLAAGGVGMMASYMMSSGSDRSRYESQSRDRERRNGSAAFVPYVMPSSRAYHSYSSGKPASSINVGKSGQVTTRSTAFKGTSTGSAARGSSYSGGG